MKMDRIEMTYRAIDEMIAKDGKQRPEKFGGGVWNAEEEFEIYKEQVGERYTKLQWKIITLYFEDKLKTLKEEKNDR
jgi:hypothetical protein